MGRPKHCPLNPLCVLSALHAKKCVTTEVNAPAWTCDEGHTFYSRYDMTGKPCPGPRKQFLTRDYLGLTGMCAKPLRRAK